MFSVQTRCCLLCLTLLLGAFVWIFLNPSTRISEKYRQMMTDQRLSKEQVLTEQAPVIQQKRWNVSKQILYNQNQQRLQTRLKSKESELQLCRSKGKMSVEEHFQSLTCEMQEKIYKRGSQKEQLIRSLAADNGVYSYATGQLQAMDVLISRSLTTGNSWRPENDKQLLFQGQAKKVQFSVLGEPSFKAQGLKASLFQWGAE